MSDEMNYVIGNCEKCGKTGSLELVGDFALRCSCGACNLVGDSQ